jgi:hypothetical protein
MPTGCIDACIADPMYGTAHECLYDWGPDPAKGNPIKHWDYHQPIYDECRRVLRPGGVLAWAQGPKFCEHFHAWFGGHRIWTLLRYRRNGKQISGHTWVVQTRDQQPIDFPPKDSLITCNALGSLTRKHPCIKPPEELAFMIEALTAPGQIVLDCFCGLGSTLVSAEQLNRLWIGCDLSRSYCKIAMQWLAHLSKEVA